MKTIAQLISAIVVATLIDFKPLAIFCVRTALFVFDLVGNPGGRVFRYAVQKVSLVLIVPTQPIVTSL